MAQVLYFAIPITHIFLAHSLHHPKSILIFFKVIMLMGGCHVVPVVVGVRDEVLRAVGVFVISGRAVVAFRGRVFVVICPSRGVESA